MAHQLVSVNCLYACSSSVAIMQVIYASLNLFHWKVTWFSLAQISHGLRMCTETPTVAQLTYSNTLFCIWVLSPSLVFLKPRENRDERASLWYVTNISETNPERTSDTDFILSILSGSCFDELIQNPDLSHLRHVDPAPNWTLPVMCKFTSDSAINISGSEWSLTRFSLISASLISAEK